MLTPEQLAAAADYIEQIYKAFEGDVIKDIARRIKKTGEFTETGQWQVARLAALASSKKYIRKAVAELGDVSQEAVNALFEFAADEADGFVEALGDAAGKTAATTKNNALLGQQLSAITTQTEKELRNLTQSMGFVFPDGQFRELEKAYQYALDTASLAVSSGTTDYKSAIRRSVKQLADSGIGFVNYDSGWVNRADVAARRAVMTGVSQLSGQISEQNMKALETDYVEVTAHAGARPEHAAWQGQVYKLHGEDGEYKNLAKATGYGTGDGLKGWNCRHDFFPFIPGVSVRSYTDDELENIDPPDFTYEGKKYNAYEATQMQRKIETSMRKTKREVLAYQSAGLDDDATAASVKLRSLKEHYRDFSSAAHLPMQNDRAQVLGFGRSAASKATWAARKAFTTPGGTVIIEAKQAGTRGVPNTISKVVAKKGGTTWNYYGADGRQNKQVSDNNHGNPKTHRFGTNGEHSHDYSFSNEGKLVRGRARELTEDERKELGLDETR